MEDHCMNDIISDLCDRLILELKKDHNKKSLNDYCLVPILSLIKNYIKIYIYSFYSLFIIFITLNFVILFFMWKIMNLLKN